MDAVIKLVAYSQGQADQYGNIPIIRTEREVFCRVESVTRNEFYQAAQNDLHPSYVFTLSHFMDYQGEREIMYTDWTGVEKTFVLVRTYRNLDEIELTAEERDGNT